MAKAEKAETAVAEPEAPIMIEVEFMKTCFVTDATAVGGSRKVMKGTVTIRALDDETKLLHERGWVRRTL